MTVLKYEVYMKYKSYNKDNRNWSVEMIIYFINNEHINMLPRGAAAYQLGNTSSRTITEVKQR